MFCSALSMVCFQVRFVFCLIIQPAKQNLQPTKCVHSTLSKLSPTLHLWRHALLIYHLTVKQQVMRDTMIASVGFCHGVRFRLEVCVQEGGGLHCVHNGVVSHLKINFLLVQSKHDCGWIGKYMGVAGICASLALVSDFGLASASHQPWNMSSMKRC